MKILFCTHTKRPKIIIFKQISQHSKTLTFVYTLYLIDFQCVLKVLQKSQKKNLKSCTLY
ncbi:unknown [Prevotella sp. CAG:520]|nr:unknown [Prevotella sp. CAG:520]